MENTKKTVCILGSANADFFIYVPKIPAPGQTIQAIKELYANGGKGANQAVAASRLLGHSLFLGQVGADAQKHRLEKQMSQSGVQLAWTTTEQSPTGRAIIYVDNSGQNCIVIIGGANVDYSRPITQLPEAYQKGIDSCDYLMLQKEIPMQINVLAAEYAKKKGKIVMLDCGGSNEQIPQSLIGNLDFISPNSTELLRIDATIDTSNVVEEIRKKLLSKFPRLTVVLKQGSHGSAVITQDLYVHVDVITKLNKLVLQDFKIIDTVGAGDCFTSAFIVKHSELNWAQVDKQQAYKECLHFGNVSAFLCITKRGAMPSLPLRASVDAFIQKYPVSHTS